MQLMRNLIDHDFYDDGARLQLYLLVTLSNVLMIAERSYLDSAVFCLHEIFRSCV